MVERKDLRPHAVRHEEAPSRSEQVRDFFDECGLVHEVRVGVVDDRDVERLVVGELERVHAMQAHARVVSELLFPSNIFSIKQSI